MIATTRWKQTPAKQPPRDLHRAELEHVFMALQTDNAAKAKLLVQQARRIGFVEMERDHWRENSVCASLLAVIGWALCAVWLVRACL